NVPVPTELQWTDTRRGEEFVLQSITVRLLPDDSLAVKAYGRPIAGGRGGYVSFTVPDRPELHALIEAAATRAAELGPATAVSGEAVAARPEVADAAAEFGAPCARLLPEHPHLAR